jgi:hypothetical protein
MFRFTIRDVLWLTVVVALAVAFCHERAKRLAFRESMLSWWSDHLHREHYTNPNDYKRLVEREGPPFSN